MTMEIPSKLNIIFLSWVFLPREIAWNFSGFACILMTENQLINALLSSSKEAIQIYKDLSDFDKVLSPT